MCDICGGIHACRAGCPNAAPPSAACPACGEMLQQGDTVYKIGEVIVGCVHCIDEAEYEDNDR